LALNNDRRARERLKIKSKGRRARRVASPEREVEVIDRSAQRPDPGAD
jgi:hypothetical protein